MGCTATRESAGRLHHMDATSSSPEDGRMPTTTNKITISVIIIIIMAVHQHLNARYQTITHEELGGDPQSRTQSPLAFWSAGGRQERPWRIRKKLNIWIGCSVTACIVLQQKSCGN